MLSHGVGLGEHGEINHFQVRKGSGSLVCFLFCAFIIQKVLLEL